MKLVRSVYIKHRTRRMFSKIKSEHQNKTELGSVINLILTLVSRFHGQEDGSLSIVCKLFGSFVFPTICVLIVTTTLQYDLIIGVPFDTPHETFAGLKAFAQLTFFGGNVYFTYFISKITMGSAKYISIILIIADSEILSTTK